MTTSYRGQIKIITYLKSRKFDIFYKNINGENIYLMAALYGKIKTMAYLETIGLSRAFFI